MLPIYRIVSSPSHWKSPFTIPEKNVKLTTTEKVASFAVFAFVSFTHPPATLLLGLAAFGIVTAYFKNRYISVQTQIKPEVQIRPASPSLTPSQPQLPSSTSSNHAVVGHTPVLIPPAVKETLPPPPASRVMHQPAPILTPSQPQSLSPAPSTSPTPVINPIIAIIPQPIPTLNQANTLSSAPAVKETLPPSTVSHVIHKPAPIQTPSQPQSLTPAPSTTPATATTPRFIPTPVINPIIAIIPQPIPALNQANTLSSVPAVKEHPTSTVSHVIHKPAPIPAPPEPQFTLTTQPTTSSSQTVVKNTPATQPPVVNETPLQPISNVIVHPAPILTPPKPQFTPSTQPAFSTTPLAANLSNNNNVTNIESTKASSQDKVCDDFEYYLALRDMPQYQTLLSQTLNKIHSECILHLGEIPTVSVIFSENDRAAKTFFKDLSAHFKTLQIACTDVKDHCRTGSSYTNYVDNLITGKQALDLLLVLYTPDLFTDPVVTTWDYTLWGLNSSLEQRKLVDKDNRVIMPVKLSDQIPVQLWPAGSRTLDGKDVKNLYIETDLSLPRRPFHTVFFNALSKVYPKADYYYKEPRDDARIEQQENHTSIMQKHNKIVDEFEIACQPLIEEAKKQGIVNKDFKSQAEREKEEKLRKQLSSLYNLKY